MTHRFDVARGRSIVARWCALAEQRLEYLTDLFETGRWRRFHNELAFLENIQEAKTAVEIWRDLATREASRDNSAVDVSWLGHARGSIQPAEILPASTCDDSVVARVVRVSSDEAPSAPEQDVPEFIQDLSAIAQRYPLLRNAL
jgi:hypothetical protein